MARWQLPFVTVLLEDGGKMGTDGIEELHNHPRRFRVSQGGYPKPREGPISLDGRGDRLPVADALSLTVHLNLPVDSGQCCQ